MSKSDVKSCMELAKLKNSVLERKLDLQNVQSGFPLYPTPAMKQDLLIDDMGNRGFLGYLKTNSKSLQEQGFCQELSYQLVDVGILYDSKDVKAGKEFGLPSVPGSSSTTTACKNFEIRQVEIIETDLPTTSTASGGKESKLEPVAVFANIRYIPIVPEIVWRQLDILLAKNFECDRKKILDHLYTPLEKFDDRVKEVLSNPANGEILEKFNFLRRELNDIGNAAYVEALIYSLLSSLSCNKRTTLFPRLYEVGRAQVPGQNMLWKEFIFSQYSDDYYKDILCMYSSLDLEMLLAHMFQIVFGLDVAQKHIGFIHNDLNVKTALGYIKVPPELYLQYSWRGKFYRVPTYGQLLKLKNFNCASIILDGVRHSDRKMTGDNDSFNVDLIRLGATLQKTIKEKQMRVHFCDKRIETVFNNMLKAWTTCSKNECTNAREAAAQAFRLKCWQEDGDEINGCMWKKFGQIPLHTECSAAVPCTQQDFFSMFEVEESKIQRGEAMYVL